MGPFRWQSNRFPGSTFFPQPSSGLPFTQALAYRARSAGVFSQRRHPSGFPRLCMATVTPLPSCSHAEHRGLSSWMDRVIKELENIRSSPDPDAVHDLRVAIRRCRSVAAVMEEVDPDPAWPAMRKVPRKLFRGLGALRDAQVMQDWVKRLAPETDPVRTHLQTAFETNEAKLRENAIRLASKFDQKTWKRLERTLRQRSRRVPVGSLAAECLALERFELARQLHAKALRTEKPKPWHDLRIRLKRTHYPAESVLPDHSV